MPFVERWRHKFQIKPNTWVFVPTDDAVENGKNVKNALENIWHRPSYYYHLRDGGHVKALHSHVKNAYFSHIDIKDFFGSINKSRVTRCLKVYMPYDEARKIAVSSTVLLPESSERKFILPFGFVQSPIIASICLRESKLGKVLHELHKTNSVTVTVYMDDIIISGDNLDYLTICIDRIKDAAERSRFYLNEEKLEGPADQVTAFNVEISQKVLKITEERFERFLSSYINAESHHQKEGILGYVASVNSEQANSIWKA
jgi:hypothetical protein